MIILAENYNLKPAFNKILKQDLESIVPFVYKLAGGEISEDVLRERMCNMFNREYECFGIYIKEKLVGVFGLYFMPRHYTDLCCEPLHIYIEEEYRGMGIGRAMFDFIRLYAEEKGCETVELNAYVHNYRSHKFYMNEGYEIKGYHFLKKL